MLRSKKKNMFNRMNYTSYSAKLGDEMLFAVTKTLVAGDIASSVATVDTGFDYTAICSVLVTATDGTIRAATKVVKDGTRVKVTATSVASTDVITVVVK